MQPEENLDLANGLHLRVLVRDDAGLLVEATSDEQHPALWGPRPAGPYSLRDAQAALSAWDPAAGGQFSIGILRGRRLLGAVGLMPDRPGSAELAYWVRPGQRGRGIAAQAVRATTPWAHRSLGIPRIWLEINPGNEPSLRVARRAGYRFEQRLPRHCRDWADEDADKDSWHDCLIWAHEWSEELREPEECPHQMRGRGMETGRAAARGGRPRRPLRGGPQHRHQGAAPPGRRRPSRDRAQLGHLPREKLATGNEARVSAHI